MMASFEIYKLSALPEPENLVANALYYILNDEFAESYITASDATPKKIGNTAMIQAVVNGMELDNGSPITDAMLAASNNIVTGINTIKGSGINNASAAIVYDDDLTPEIGGYRSRVWKEFKPLEKGRDHASFFINQSTKSYGDWPGNEVLMMGWNLGPGGGAVVAGKPAVGIGFEQKYSPADPDDSFTEYHDYYVDLAGNQVRLMSYTINDQVKDIDRYNTIHREYYKNPDNIDHIYARLSLNGNAVQQQFKGGNIGYNWHYDDQAIQLIMDEPMPVLMDSAFYVQFPSFTAHAAYNEFTTETIFKNQLTKSDVGFWTQGQIGVNSWPVNAKLHINGDTLLEHSGIEVLTVKSTGIAARLVIDSIYQYPNTGLALMQNGLAVWNLASHSGRDFSFYNSILGRNALTIRSSDNKAIFDALAGVGRRMLVTEADGMIEAIEMGIAQTGLGNLLLGKTAFNPSGDWNIAIGYQAAEALTTGQNNIAIGTQALQFNQVSINNVAVGNYAMQMALGAGNTAIGINALQGNDFGNRNVAIGESAGHNSEGSDNIFLGRFAGYSEPGNGKLYIANDAWPLIWGDFALRHVTINPSGEVPVSAGFNLDVNGTFRSVGDATFLQKIYVSNTILAETPANGTLETDGTNLYFTIGGVRKTITLT